MPKSKPGFLTRYFKNRRLVISTAVAVILTALGGVAAAVGLVFGLYPARQASLKSPIEALRYE